jgi:ABC-2 type transport system ATP-binding protein
MHRPAVLFLDEPTAGLDPQSRLSLWDAVHELNESGQTILLTTHYMEEADQLCQRVAIMDHGHILALDTPAGLKRSVDADTIVTVHAAGDPNELVPVMTALHGVAGASVAAGGVLVNLRGAEPGMLPRMLVAAENAGIHVEDVSIAEPTLETVFITLTGKELRD